MWNQAFSLAIPAGAVGDDSKGKENGATVEMVEESIQEPSSPNNLYDYYWDIRVINESRGFGSWREGPSGTGPAYLDMNQGTALNRNYTNTSSGEYSAGTEPPVTLSLKERGGRPSRLAVVVKIW